MVILYKITSFEKAGTKISTTTPVNVSKLIIPRINFHFILRQLSRNAYNPSVGIKLPLHPIFPYACHRNTVWKCNQSPIHDDPYIKFFYRSVWRFFHSRLRPLKVETVVCYVEWRLCPCKHWFTFNPVWSFFAFTVSNSV